MTADMVTSFVEAALSDRRAAEELLAAHPEIADAGLYPALVLGDAKRVEHALGENPDVNAKSGPRQWQPLLYVCFSRCAGDMAGTARVLLRRGADPNACYFPEDWPDNPLSCLYGATGFNNNPALAVALLDSGARTDDGESLYHSTEHPDLVCMKLLLARGASVNGTNALFHILDREDMDGLQCLLDAGADPNEVIARGETALHWAVWRGRSAAVITALLDHGANINAERADGRTAYAMAALSGQTEIASLLASRGAKTELSELDRFISTHAVADPRERERLLAEHPSIADLPGSERLLPDLSTSHRAAAVRALLAAGMPVNARGEHGATALHWACWKGYPDLVQLLLDHGASLAIEDEQFHATPAGWLAHGRENCPERGGDYAEVERLIAQAARQSERE